MVLIKISLTPGSWIRKNFMKFYPSTPNKLCKYFSVLEDFIGPDRLSNMIAGTIKVRKQARRARKESKDIIVATPGRVRQMVVNNIIRLL